MMRLAFLIYCLPVLRLSALIAVLTCSSCAQANDYGIPLLNAVSRGDYDETVRLLNSGHEIDAKDPYGKTALILASYGSSSNIVELLLKKGADTSARTNLGTTPLHAACSKTRSANAYLLLRYGALVNATNTHGQTPLFKAVAVGPAKLVEMLLQKDADVGVTDATGWQPLHHALHSSQLSHGSQEKQAVVVLLLKYGADPSVRNPSWKERVTQGDSKPSPFAIFQRRGGRSVSGDTPLIIARENGMHDIAKLLEKAVSRRASVHTQSGTAKGSQKGQPLNIRIPNDSTNSTPKTTANNPP